MFISHGIREDTQIVLHLEGDGSRRIKFDGNSLKGVHPDERSISGHVRAVTKTQIPPVGFWREYSHGIAHSGGSIGETLQEWTQEGCEILVMDANGTPVRDFSFGGVIGFVLSDHKPFTDAELELLSNYESASLGDKWLQCHSCISIVHHHLDGY